jgi:hypothetical protein
MAYGLSYTDADADADADTYIKPSSVFCLLGTDVAA